MVQPFTLGISRMARMVNCELTDDPHYAGLEIQVFDDEQQGSGLLVLVERRADRKVDVYHQPGLRLDRSGYGIGAGLGRWDAAATVEPAVVEIGPDGLRVDVGLTDADGRRIEVRIDDRDGRRRRPAPLLAPVGAAIEYPASLMLVWMPRFDLVRRSGRPPEVVIDGRPAATGRLPAAALHRRHLVKYTEGLCVVSVNPAVERQPVAADGLVPVIEATDGPYRAILTLTPALPDLAAMVSGESAEGRWRVGVDTATLTGGTWRAARRDHGVELTVAVDRRWRPRRLPALMRLVTTAVPVFRTWPTTYRWEASVDLDGAPTMTSRWTRTDTTGGDSYARATGHGR